MIKQFVILMLIIACFLFLAHAVLPHEHEGGHVADVLPANTHSHHDNNATQHHHGHESDSDHKDKSDDYCLLDIVIPSRIFSLPEIFSEKGNNLEDYCISLFFIAVCNPYIEPPEKIPDKPGISDHFIKLSNPNFKSSGLRAPPLSS